MLASKSPEHIGDNGGLTSGAEVSFRRSMSISATGEYELASDTEMLHGGRAPGGAEPVKLRCLSAFKRKLVGVSGLEGSPARPS